MRLIDADALKNRLEDLRSYTMLGEGSLYYDGETNALSVAILNIDKMPTIDAVPVKHGYWRKIQGVPDWDQQECSECGDYFCCQLNYCPHCGAKMDGEKVNE